MRFGPASLASLAALWGCTGTTSCFAAGTRVATPRGPVRIEDLRVGDAVWAWDTERSEAVARRVLKVHRSQAERILAVRFGELVLHVTPEHPVWDAATSAWRPAGLLEGAAALAWFPGAEPRELAFDGAHLVGPGPVWNLSVEGEQTFFAEGVLVHNKTYGDETLWQHFPFDGERTWTYRSHDPDTTWDLEVTATLLDEAQPHVYRMIFVRRCREADGCVDGTHVATVDLSSDVANGTLAHGFGADGGFDALDPPWAIAPHAMRVGELVATQIDGEAWGSTLAGFEPCDQVVLIQGASFEAVNCAAHLVLERDGRTDDVLTGDLWAAKGLGIVGFEWGYPAGLWGLVDATCEGDCNGEW